MAIAAALSGCTAVIPFVASRPTAPTQRAGAKTSPEPGATGGSLVIAFVAGALIDLATLYAATRVRVFGDSGD